MVYHIFIPGAAPPDVRFIENPSGHVAGGNGTCTMTDLNKYIRNRMQGRNVLTPETVTLIQNSEGPAKPKDGSRYPRAAFIFRAGRVALGYPGI